jgi:hypothetical protein
LKKKLLKCYGCFKYQGGSMKLRLRIRHNMQPSDHSIGWKKGRPIVRLTKVQIEMAEMLGIPSNIYAKHYAQLKLGGSQ